MAKYSPEEVDAFKKQLAAHFDSLTEEQKRNVMNWGNVNGLGEQPTSAAIAFPKTDFPALDKVREMASTMNVDADANRAYFQMLMQGKGIKGFGPGGPGVRMDPYWKIYPTSNFANVDIAGAGMNTDAATALAEQMGRLKALYPGITDRMANYLVGLDPNGQAMAWFRPHGRIAAGAPGELAYDIGSPAQATFLRQVIGHTYRPSRGELIGSATPVSESGWHSYNRALYPSQLEGTMAHELGHATQHTMRDFVKGLPPESDAAKQFDYFTNILGTAGPGNAAISDYAAEASRQAMATGLGTFRASEEPFADLFAAARSPQGLDIGSPNVAVRQAAIKDVIGAREPRAAETLMDRIGLLNSTEKSLRNTGFSEVGSVAPELAMQIGLPALAGLLASKTHGTAKSALTGAATGAALGGLAGPEGTLVGGALGAGVGLARQLL